jgi:hypothetical protein
MITVKAVCLRCGRSFKGAEPVCPKCEKDAARLVRLRAQRQAKRERLTALKHRDSAPTR